MEAAGSRRTQNLPTLVFAENGLFSGIFAKSVSSRLLGHGARYQKIVEPQSEDRRTKKGRSGWPKKDGHCRPDGLVSHPFCRSQSSTARPSGSRTTARSPHSVSLALATTVVPAAANFS